MILLCGGEGGAGVETGGVFFLLISYGGRSGRGGYAGLEAAARRRVERTMAPESGRKASVLQSV
jgi:hypothetical protein